MPRPEAFLRLVDIAKQFGRFTALHGISLEVFKGEFICCVGPSGCGKTTLLRIIAGLDAQTTGQVFQAGAEISALPAARRDFGIVFQSYALFPNLTVARNVAFGIENRGLARLRVRERVAELLDLVGLAEQADKFPAQLSGGQQQRVALARALAPAPSLLLLDEPLSALDAQVRARLRGEIRALQRRLGVTTVMVTHDQEEALTMADRIVVMAQGRIDQIGTPEQVYRHPATPFVAEFLGRMNVLPGRRLPGDRVAVGDVTLHCAAGACEGTTETVTLCIRPEDIAIGRASGDCANMVSARVERLEFMGSYYTAHLAPRGIAAPLEADLSAQAVRDLALRPGEWVEAALPRDRLRVFFGWPR
ncbi:MAG: putative 2-aminoethylphosphonate ABC transporter ATP-binding protein [Alphaproteobacteria bacterium]|nr:putative 2-aminoethylphosphonate ABC transporter ATP-binding protein [Alphaproteobacteria bacterium]